MLSPERGGGIVAAARHRRDAGASASGPTRDIQLAIVSEAAPGLAEFVNARPDLLDRLDRDLEAAFGEDFARALAALAATAATTGDYLSGAYRLYRRHKTLAGLAFLLGRLPVERAGRVHADLADTMLRSVVGVCEAEFVAIHGRICGGRHALVALGKFGSRELTACSDLDLLLLYDLNEHSPVSDGKQPLTGCQYYGRLAQRMIAALTCNFGDGPLFDVDFRLRPWGSKGPIATHLGTLRDYFASEAWTFEAMALTRARVVAGSVEFVPAVEATVRQSILMTAALRNVRSDVVIMRKLVQQEKASRRVWDIKCVAGGLMDIDFIVQGLALAHVEALDGVAMSDTQGVLGALVNAGHLAATDAQVLVDALGLYQIAIQLLRISGLADPRQMPAALANILSRATGCADIKGLETRLRAAQREVRRIYEATLMRRDVGRCVRRKAA